MYSSRYVQNEPINEPVQKKSCREILQEWLDQPNTQDKWAKLTYKQISKQIREIYGQKISDSSIAIHLPALVAERTGKSVKSVLEIRESNRRNARLSGAKIDQKRLVQLKAYLDAGVDPKICAAELKMHYNTVLKYKRIWEKEQQKPVNNDK